MLEVKRKTEGRSLRDPQTRALCLDLTNGSKEERKKRLGKTIKFFKTKQIFLPHSELPTDQMTCEANLPSFSTPSNWAEPLEGVRREPHGITGKKSQWQQHFIPSSMLAGSYLNITSTKVPYLTGKSALIEEKLINWADPHELYETHYFTICYLNSWTAACVKQTETNYACLWQFHPVRYSKWNQVTHWLIVVSGKVPPLLFFSLQISRHALTHRSYVATFWCAVHLSSPDSPQQEVGRRRDRLKALFTV